MEEEDSLHRQTGGLQVAVIRAKQRRETRPGAVAHDDEPAGTKRWFTDTTIHTITE